MADDADFHVDLKALEEDFARAMRECPRDLFEALKPAGDQFLEQWIGRGIKAGRFNRGDGLKTRSDSLRKAFAHAATGSDMDSLKFAAGTIHRGLPYAHIQEFGGEVTPRKGKFLTVPLEAALTAAGVLRQPARSWPDTFVRMGKTGQSGVILQRRGEEEIPLFALVKRVRIAGRLGFFDSWKRNEPGFIKHLGQAVGRALAKNAARGQGGSA